MTNRKYSRSMLAANEVELNIVTIGVYFTSTVYM